MTAGKQARPAWRWAVGMAAFVIAALATFQIHQTTRGLSIDSFEAGPVPITVFRDESQPTGPLVIVAHGFAGSRPMMQEFAVSLAQNGYVAATFDFSGHGRNRVPLTGDLLSIDGATRVLVSDIAHVVDAVRQRYPGLPDAMAVLGHSMASDLVVRYAQQDDTVMATVGVAMFSPAVTATSPRNLLIINGAWETRLNKAAHDVLAQATDDAQTREEVTYGHFEDGTARRLVRADHTEHVAVLFSVESATAALTWLDQVFDAGPAPRAQVEPRGRWILLLIASIVAAWWSLSPLLPAVSSTAGRSPLTARRSAMILLLPMVATPLLLSLFSIDFLPVLVGDYLAVHLAVYGLITLLVATLVRRNGRTASEPVSMDSERATPLLRVNWRAFWHAVLMLLLFSLPLAAVLNWQVVSFIPTIERLPLLLAIAAGTLCWFVVDEWATRTCMTWRWAYPASKLAFLLSLGIAVALDFDGLFFLLLIVPIMVPILLVFGLLSRWSWQSTGYALVAGVSNAVFLAWAIAVTFPWVGAGA